MLFWPRSNQFSLLSWFMVGGKVPASQFCDTSKCEMDGNAPLAVQDDGMAPFMLLFDKSSHCKTAVEGDVLCVKHGWSPHRPDARGSNLATHSMFAIPTCLDLFQVGCPGAGELTRKRVVREIQVLRTKVRCSLHLCASLLITCTALCHPEQPKHLARICIWLAWSTFDAGDDHADGMLPDRLPPPM